MTFEEFKSKYQKVEIQEFPNKVLEKVPNPLVSIRITTYQHGRFIKEAIESVLMQKVDFPIEIIIGDDESTDGTREICIEYAKKYPELIRLFLHKRENNIQLRGKPTHLFQYVHNSFLCRGKYIAALAGDDRWNDPLAISKLYNIMEMDSKRVISYYDANVINADGNVIRTSRLNENNKRNYSSDELFGSGVFMIACTRFVRRVSFYQDFPEIICKSINEDAIISHLLSYYGYGYFAEEVLPASYRMHGDSIWSSKKRIEQKKYSLDTHQILYLFSNKHIEFERRIINNKIEIGYLSAKEKDWYEAKNNFKDALSLSFKIYNVKLILKSIFFIFKSFQYAFNEGK